MISLDMSKTERGKAMYFADKGHRERFAAALQQIGRVYDDGKVDQEYGAALYILTADEGFWNDVKQYVKRNEIDMEALEEQHYLSSGYFVLIRVAWNLFHGMHRIDLTDLMLLDENNFQIALAAIQIRRHMWRLAELLGEG
jgi:hypothetical protein